MSLRLCSRSVRSFPGFGYRGQEEPCSDSDEEVKEQAELPGIPRSCTEDNDEDTEQVATPGALSLLTTLPLDVQLEIFSNLFPKDILNLARATKDFRGMLMTKKATSVWRESREKTSVPECPPWLSEPSWAALLFEQDCEYCYVKKFVKFDLMILRKFCRTCQDQNAVSEKQLGPTYGGVKGGVFDLVLPLEQRFTRDHGKRLLVRGSPQRLFWEADVQNIYQKQNDLQKRLHMGLPGAQATLDDFRAQLKERCAYIMKSYPGLYAWRQEYFDQRRAEISKRRLRFRDQIKERLISMGHAEPDLSFLDLEPTANKTYMLNDRKWEILKPIFVTEAVRVRNIRLENECRILFSKFEARYISYKTSIHPSQWRHLLPFRLLLVLEPFFAHTNPEKPLETPPKIIDELFRTLPGLLGQIDEERTVKLVSLLPRAKPSTPGHLDSSEVSTTLPHLERATSVFKCIEGDYLFGIDEIRAHHCGARTPSFQMTYPFTGYGEYCERRREVLLNPQLQYVSKAATVVGKLAAFVGLDPASATVSDLDRCIDSKNDGGSMRFACVGCTVRKEPYEYQFYRCGYNWRCLAAHFDSVDADHNPSLSFTELTLTQTEEIKCREMEESSNQLKWACALCVVHVNAPQTRELVEKHLITDHACDAIKNPIEAGDLVVTDTSSDRLRCTKFVVAPSALVLSPTSQVTDDTRCCRCTRAQDRVRVRTPAAVKDHLRSKHDITSPQVGLDYEYIILE